MTEENETVMRETIPTPTGLVESDQILRWAIFLQLANPECQGKGLVENCAAVERWIKDGIGGKLKAVQ